MSGILSGFIDWVGGSDEPQTEVLPTQENPININSDNFDLSTYLDNLDKGIDAYGNFKAKTSPGADIGYFIQGLFSPLTNGLKSIGEPTIKETFKLVALVYAVGYAWSIIKSPPKRTYSYKSSNRFNYRGRGKGFTYG